MSGSETKAPWRAVALTLFPEMFPGSLGQSLAGKAMEDGLWSMDTVDIRDFGFDKHRNVDDTPFGGGAGMVMRPDVVDPAINHAKTTFGGDVPLIYMTPRGRPLTQKRVRELAEGPGVAVLCGRFEGVDQRVLDAHEAEEISVGDYVLSGGELAALILMDACVRLIPGVMGSDSSHEEESFEAGLLEYPHFTRPQDWAGRKVPDMLLSGHHANIRAWRREQAEAITRERRPDLWEAYQAAERDEN
ncbi:tRNA (guanosine(37)-N1)-methyltransferase TrmD [Magnetovibrio sp. PR-2]|uniref:tRNA (guanosine(37)-N1)-methyltransferase TrmD n=1 Tax=Magnetovibrio sp. PR-2 TaxID=3120356 RepID=UPI002FCE5C6D